jgi:hypothetical protein
LAILLELAKLIRNCGPDRNDYREILSEEHFPAITKGRCIVGHQGTVIATAADSAIAEEITQRLNESEWRRHEDRWALCGTRLEL